jgi:hypothetical protein
MLRAFMSRDAAALSSVSRCHLELPQTSVAQLPTAPGLFVETYFLPTDSTNRQVIGRSSPWSMSSRTVSTTPRTVSSASLTALSRSPRVRITLSRTGPKSADPA